MDIYGCCCFLKVFLDPNLDKPEPKLTAKTKKERFYLELDSTGSSQTGTHKGKNKNFLIS
jgi:hypothetical protein